MNRCTAALFASLSILPVSAASGQGGVVYNRGFDPASVRYEPRPSGGHEVSVELRLSNLTTDTIDLSSVLTMRVNGALVGVPASLPIEAGPLGANIGCRPNWCATVCHGLCINFGNRFCLCVNDQNVHHSETGDGRIAMPTPPLTVGDVVELSLAAAPGSPPEIDPGDDLVVFTIQRTPCAADLDGDGDATSQDFFLFLTAFFNGSILADVNGDGAVTSQDFFDFLAVFFSGC